MPGATTRIAFGSCYDQGRATHIWEQVKNITPDLFIWTGDIIYPDRPIPWPGNNLEKIQHKYAMVKGNAAYSNLIEKIPVIGIYDDHDYGINNGGKTYKWKEQSQQHLLNFLDEPAHSERRFRKGAYTSYTLRSKESFIKIIILDLRYHREKLGINNDILGDAQWKWLEAELQNSAVDFTIIVSSLSVLSTDKLFEGWIHFPKARLKLLDLFLRFPQKQLLIVSGDKHFAELNELNYAGYVFHEFIASGLTHSEKPPTYYNNNIDASQQYLDINFGFIDLENLEHDEIILKVINQKGKTVMQKILHKQPVTTVLR